MSAMSCNVTHFLFGIVGSYTYARNFILRAEGKFSYGQVDYESAGTGTLDNIDDYMTDHRILIFTDGSSTVFKNSDNKKFGGAGVFFKDNSKYNI